MQSTDLMMLDARDMRVAARVRRPGYGVDPSTIWRWLKKGQFPQPKRFGPQTLRWAISDLESHEAEAA